LTSSLKSKTWTTQAEYAKALRPFLPAEAFLPDPNKAVILVINLAILVLGWGIAHNLDRWSWYWLWLYLPLSLIMGNSIIVLLFSSHDMMHSKAIKNPKLRQILSLLGLTMLWMPPTLWKAVHNREHHQNTNALTDPDRNYFVEHPNNWGKWIHNQFAPSSEVNPFWLFIGMAHSWGVHQFRHLSSILLFNDGATTYPQAAFKVSPKERKAIAVELLMLCALHFGIVLYVGLHPINLLLGYFLPIWIGHTGAMIYIYTNHLLCPMTPVNDPLVNSVSLRVPKIFDCLHLNFSYHTEHHIFPGMNSDYYPLVQQLLQKQYGDRYNLLDISEAWWLLRHTPRHYHDDQTLTDWANIKRVPCLSPAVEPVLIAQSSVLECSDVGDKPSRE
jgi:fatty acid desaturase